MKSYINRCFEIVTQSEEMFLGMGAPADSVQFLEKFMLPVIND